MGNLDNQFWKPDPETVISLQKFKQTRKPKRNDSKKQKKATRRAKQKRSRQEREKARAELLNYFKLHKYATNIAICLCIHNETDHPMPGDERQAKQMILEFWRHTEKRHHNRFKFMPADEFYSSKKWRELRYIALHQSEGTCTLCGAKASDGIQLHVDHIKPRSRFPKLQFNLDNLQVLCEDCNLGKSNYDDTDWRSK